MRCPECQRIERAQVGRIRVRAALMIFAALLGAAYTTVKLLVMTLWFGRAADRLGRILTEALLMSVLWYLWLAANRHSRHVPPPRARYWIRVVASLLAVVVARK